MNNRDSNDIDYKEIICKLSQFYKIFGDETRIRILNLLIDKSLCVNDIAASLGMSQSSISHQLQVLRYANFVRTEKQGKVVYYSLADSHIKIILKYGFEHIMEGDM